MPEPLFLTNKEQRMLLSVFGSMPDAQIVTEKRFPRLDAAAVAKKLQTLSFDGSPAARDFAKHMLEKKNSGDALDHISIEELPEEMLAPFLACLGPGGMTMLIEQLIADAKGKDILTALISLCAFRHQLQYAHA